ncbi:MAG: TolC family protein [Verrucomicrobiales bacterium]|nr:TolC family protein [Verrucomicrobiales bacterium]
MSLLLFFLATSGVIAQENKPYAYASPAESGDGKAPKKFLPAMKKLMESGNGDSANSGRARAEKSDSGASHSGSNGTKKKFAFFNQQHSKKTQAAGMEKTEADDLPGTEVEAGYVAGSKKPFGKLNGFFANKKQEKPAMVTQTIVAESQPEENSHSPVLADLYPTTKLANVRENSKACQQVRCLLDEVTAEMIERIEGYNDPELFVRDEDMAKGEILGDWSGEISKSLWGEQKRRPGSLASAYQISLQHSKQVKSLSRVPLIYEASAKEALVDFSAEFFANGDFDHTDEPTGSTLTTGRTGRFLQDDLSSDYGYRKKLYNGAQVQLVNRLSTLDNNSTYLDPNPQTGSELVLSLLHPLIRGGGTDYSLTTFRIAKLESDVAAVTFLQRLQDHLIEVNRAYWAVYLSRAAYYQRQELTRKTREIVNNLEERRELDPEATSSELLRARASLKKREADIKRAKMGVRIAEDKLRSLVNDPELPAGAAGEWIPTSKPVLEAPVFNIRPVALAALANRPELIQGVLAVEAAAVQMDQSKNELKPQLDLVTEVGYSGLDGGRDLGGALSDMTDHGTEFRGGLRFSHQLERGFIRGRTQRRQLEYLQRVDELHLIADRVMLEVLTAYREMLAAYRDMVGKNQTLIAAREEVSDLEKRVDLEADAEARTVGYYLQLRLGALERQQVAEEESLVSVVAYNTALATLEQAQGTFLQYQNVEVFREEAMGKCGVDSLHIQSSKP